MMACFESREQENILLKDDDLWGDDLPLDIGCTFKRTHTVTRKRKVSNHGQRRRLLTKGCYDQDFKVSTVTETVREDKPLSPIKPASSPKSPVITTPALSPTNSKEISYPRAANDEKLQEFTSSKQYTIQQMLNEAMHQYQSSKEEFDKHPNDVNQINLENKEKVIRRLKSQLSLVGENPVSPTTEGSFRLSASGASAKEPDRRSCCMENSASSLDEKEDSSSSSCGLPPHAIHAPYNMKKGKLKSRNAYLHNSSLSRSHSDSYKQRQQYLDSLKPSVSSDDFRSMVDNTAIGKRRQNSVLSRSHSKSQGGTSDDADLLHPLAEEHSASSLDVSNSTNSISGHRNSQQSITIMAFDEEDVSDEGEKRENHFSKFEEIRNKPAHLAVFLHYLISNSDPAPLLFYLVTEGFGQGSGKDMRRWAYELYTTFLYEKAPLNFVVTPTSILDAITEVLSNKSDKEDKLVHLFEHVRSVSLALVKELFGDFRNKLSLGLGSFYGEHELKGVNNHASEISLIDKYLWRQFITLTSEENDRSSATCSAMLTYFRSIGLPQVSSFVDRFPPFVYKEKTKFSVFSKSNKKITTQSYDHNLQQHQYCTITYCNACQGLIGGVGFQGYICLKCEHNFHKSCMANIKDKCKRVDRSKTTPNILRKKISVKGGNVPMKQGELDQAEFSILPRASSLMSLKESGKSGRFLKDKDRGILNIVKDSNKDISLMPAVKLLRDDSLKTDQTSSSNSATTATKQQQQSEPYRGGSPEPDDESKEFYDPVNKFFPNQHIPALSNNSQVEISSDSDFEAENDVPLLESYIPKDFLKKVKPKEKKRQNIINELFHTERTHVRNMKVMQHVIFLRMNNEFQKDFVNLLFPNLDELIRVHDDLNKEFKRKKKESENFVVENFADILVRHFTGEKSEEFKKVCAVFCEKQPQALEKLKVRQKKDQKLSSFLQEAANNPLCRRFELKDLLPTAMQRLTKYPLFISSLLKYTSDSEECKKLELALEGSKSILEHVDKAVQRYEDHLRLVDMQKRLDKKAIEAATSGPLAEYRNLDLTRHTLVFDGPLTWRITKDRLIPLHVVLLEDILLLLQKQDDRLVLKCQSMYIAAGKVDTRMTHSPIIKLVNLLIKPVATDHSAFFIVSQITEFPQIYDLIAPSKEEKDKWCRRLTAALEAYKLVNPEAWKAYQTHPAKQKVHHRTSAPTSPVADGSSSMPLIHDSAIPDSEEAVHKDHSSLPSMNDRPRFSFESQLSNTTLTDMPRGDEGGEYKEHHEEDDDYDDGEDHDRFDRDNGEEHSRLIRLRKMDEKIHRVIEDKRALVNSLYQNKVEDADAAAEAPQKPSPSDSLCAVQSLLLDLDKVLKLCNEMESRETTPLLQFDEAENSNDRTSDSMDVQSSQSLMILPSRLEIDEEVQTDLVSSQSDSQLSSTTKSEQTSSDLSHFEPSHFEESRGEETRDTTDLQKDTSGEVAAESEDEAPMRLNKLNLLRTCHSLQTELRNLLELILTDQSQNQAFADEQAELERPVESAEPSAVEVSEGRHDADPSNGAFEQPSDNSELENPEIKEQNRQGVAETSQLLEPSDEAVHESS